MKKRVRNLLKQAAILIYKIMNKGLPLKKNLIVLNGSSGRNYTGNVRSIYEAMIENALDQTYECVWFFRDPNVKIPGNAKIITYGGLKYLYYMAVARIWVFDCRQPGFLRKKEGVTYIQTWHGTPLKKLALDMEDVFMAGDQNIEHYKEAFRQNASSWDYLISQNPFSTETFSRCFAFSKIILECGYPRNDALVQKNNATDIRSLKQNLGLPNNKKIILYAPTWRDDEYNEKGQYRFTHCMDFSLLKAELEKEYVIIVKYHYLVEEAMDWTPYKGFVYSFDSSYDISELYLVSDLLITDYSSVMFDYSVLRRPIYFYCYDLDNYKNHLRGFYFDLEQEAPGPISRTTCELLDQIQHASINEYKERYQTFCETYNPWDKGAASGTVAKLIENCLEGKGI